MSKGHIVNHTHWDREWYFTTCDSLVLSEEIFLEILEELEKHPKASFCLDGQTSIIDDYIGLYPLHLPRVQALVKEKQLFIGPWYTQSDALLPTGESILRNAMIGVRDAKRYGNFMRVGYLPDTFGFQSQMPTLLRQAGIDNIVFWRGIDFQKQVSSPYFKWKGLGKQEVYAINIPLGYTQAPKIQTTKEYIQKRLDTAIDFVLEQVDTDDILIPAGGDQQRIIKDIHKKVDTINEMGVSNHEFEVSDYENFIEKIRHKSDLPVYEGDFRLPAYTRVHRSIASSRSNIKQKNFLLEVRLIQRIEPLLVIAQTMGIRSSIELLVKAWKNVLEGQAHDSLGGCVFDVVAQDIFHRFEKSEEILEGIENIITKKIADSLDLKEHQILIFNTLPYETTAFHDVIFIAHTDNITFEDVEIAICKKKTYYPARKNIVVETPEGKTYVDEKGYYRLEAQIKTTLPALGYRVINFHEKTNTMISFIEAPYEHSITNDIYTILFCDNQLHLQTKNEKITSFIEILDCGNDGDTYDFSPLKDNQEIALSFERVEVKKSIHSETMIVFGTSELPLTLQDRFASENTGLVSIELHLTLNQKDELIHGKLSIDNQIYSHRLRMKLHTHITTDTTLAGVSAGYMQYVDGIDENTKMYPEYPIDLQIFDRSVSIHKNQKNVHFFGYGLKEYQHINDDLYITLMATTGELGKANLIYRPGRASGDTTNQGHIMQATPDAQMIGTHIYPFALQVNEGVFNELEVTKLAQQLTTPTISYQKQNIHRFLYRLDNKLQDTFEIHNHKAQLYSMLNLPTTCIMSGLHPSFYDENAFVLRLVNPTKKDMVFDLINLSNYRYEIVNALEEVISCDSIIRAYDYLSIKCYLKKEEG